MLGMPKASATTRLNGAGPKAVRTKSVPIATAAIKPSPSWSRNSANTNRLSSGEGAAIRARVSATGSPGSGRYSRLHPRTRSANMPCAASATRCPACCNCCPSPVNGARSEERRVGKSVDLGGRRIIKKKKKKNKQHGQTEVSDENIRERLVDKHEEK